MEYWKDIINYRNLYQVSTSGRVRSVDRYITQKHTNTSYKRFIKGRILKYHINNKGYCLVGLSKNGKVKEYLVHRLVLETFIGLNENYNIVEHNDNNPLNNHISNLVWSSPEINMRHCFEQGRAKIPKFQGENHPRAKLTEKQVKTIKVRLKKGELGTHIAKDYNVSRRTIYDIKNNRNWVHIK